jgi:serine protease Do
VTTALGLEFSPQTEELKKRYSIKDGTKGVIITKVDPIRTPPTSASRSAS